MSTNRRSSKVEMTALTVICSVLMIAGVGCETGTGSPGAGSDTVLKGMAIEEGARLAAVFHMPAPNMDDISIGWGAISEYSDNDNYYRITIREDLEGNEDALRRHVRHEMFHAMTGLRDGDQTSYHGVLIAGVVAWED